MPVCKYCKVELEGRIDKKYCNQYCKSAHQYHEKQKTEERYHTIDRQLKTNRKILKAYNKKGFTTIRKDELIAQGFNPKYFTHYYRTNGKNLYWFCYEYGFMDICPDGKEKFLLVNWQEYMDEQV